MNLKNQNAPRLWSKKIYQVLKYYHDHEHPDLFLFAVTGDIDNLGMFISRNGRAAGQNLIDVYLRLMGLFMHVYVREHREDIMSFAFLPAGEEVTVMGVARTKEACQEFFDVVQNRLSRFIVENDPIIGDENVTVAFGCKVICESSTLLGIKEIVSAVEGREITKANDLYFRLMTEIRVQLAHEVDRVKFSDLTTILPVVGPVFLRNIIYLNMQRYKFTTRQILLKINGNGLEVHGADELIQNYGVSHEQGVWMEGFLKQS